MDEGKKIFWSFWTLFRFASFFFLMTLAVFRLESASSALAYPPEGETFPLLMSGSVEMLPARGGQWTPPTQSPVENGTTPPTDGAKPSTQPDESGAAPSQPATGIPPQQFGGAPPFPDMAGMPPPFPTETANATSFCPVRVDRQTWEILIVESVILALGIAFAFLYKKERS